MQYQHQLLAGFAPQAVPHVWHQYRFCIQTSWSRRIQSRRPAWLFDFQHSMSWGTISIEEHFALSCNLEAME